MNLHNDSIFKYLNQSMDATEKEVFVSQLKHDLELREEFFKRKDIWDYYGTKNIAGKYNKEELWQLINSKVEIKSEKRLTIGSILKIASVAASLIITFLIGYFLSPEQSVISNEAHVFTTNKGQIANLELADGSRVVLNGGSKLLIPTEFGSKKRAVNLEGEAYFDVEHNKEKPFSVQSNNQNIRVLGTKFNVRAYPDEAIYKTTLIDGSVEWSNGEHQIVMKPGMQIEYNLQNNAVNTKEVDALKAKNWVKGRFEFKDAPFTELIRVLEEWYSIKISYESKVFKTYRLNGAFDRSRTLEENLQFIQFLLPIQYKIIDNQVQIKLE